jgi:hypothetical protein
MPPFKAIDIFSGKTDIIYHFVVCLMNSSIPVVNKTEKDYFEKKISIYYQIVNEIEELKQQKTASITKTFYENEDEGTEKEKENEKEKEHKGEKDERERSSDSYASNSVSVASKQRKKEKIDKIEEKNEEEPDEGKDEGIEGNINSSISQDSANEGMTESIEIKTKSVLDQLYEFFIAEATAKKEEVIRQHQQEEEIKRKQFEEQQRGMKEIFNDDHHFHSSVTTTVTTTTTNILDGPPATPESLKGAGGSSSHPSSAYKTGGGGVYSRVQSSSVDHSHVHSPSLGLSQSYDDPSSNDPTLNNPELRKLHEQIKGLQKSLPKIEYSLDMSDTSYSQLCNLLDEFIISPESSRILEFSEKSFIISEKLAELQSAISLLRDHRDEGIRLTSDLRQFVISQAMRYSVLHLRHSQDN